MPRATSVHSVDDLVDRARAGDARATARLVTLVEAGSSQLPALARRLSADAGGASCAVLGLTGSPGVGKSTLTTALVRELRLRGQRVGVLAVDPSSPFTGGALLGDRVRMQEHATDPGVFIRSMASRGHLGGLSAATPQAVRVLAGTGFDVVVVETVGVGQSEVEVAAAADTVVVVVAPGMGDGVQAAKAGVLEIGDVYVVNKADREGAPEAARELRQMLRLGHEAGGTGADGAAGGWDRPVVRTSATDGTGLDDLLTALDAHRAWAERTGALVERRRRRAADEIAALAAARLRSRAASPGADGVLERLAEAVRTGATDPYSAADELLAVSAAATQTARS